MLIASISIGFAPSSKVCDFRLALESDAQKEYTANRSVYSTNRSFYESLGVKTTSAVCVNAQNVGPGKPKDACHKHCNTSCCVGSIYEYIDQSDTTIQKCWDQSNLANELTPDGIGRATLLMLASGIDMRRYPCVFTFFYFVAINGTQIIIFFNEFISNVMISISEYTINFQV